MYKPSKNPKVEELSKSHKLRSVNLGTLQAVKKTEDSKLYRYCAWCVEVRLTHGNQKYCSQDCSQSAMAWAYPQKEDALRFLLERQEWKCFSCQYDYKPWLDKITEKDRNLYKGYEDYGKLSWYYFKRLKECVPKEFNPEVDHIIPISKGGESLGLSNTCALCYSCHKKKTSKDLSGKRKVNS